MSDHEEADPLELLALDTDSLMTALANVEKAVPDLLLDIKPVLAHLVSPGTGGANDEASGMAARRAVEHYMSTLDKIQYILRQTVYYLHETRAAPSVLRPPPASGIPHPLAATLRTEGGEPALGLYGARVEVAALRDMLESIKAMRIQHAAAKEAGAAKETEAS